MESTPSGQLANTVQYAFRRPRFPVIYAVGSEVLAATTSTVLLRQLRRLDLPGVGTLDLVDATGEGWAFHSATMIVSPLTMKKRWTKLEVIRLFNASDNARRIGARYPESYIPRRSFSRIIAEVAALAAGTRRRASVSAARGSGSSPGR